ncbi:MAG: hypothetical protein H0W58_16245 [Acidobacteria bacterium]|jgi:hypothetical protein|nr:hypothetical protein [Acidobacteriota bacterium]
MTKKILSLIFTVLIFTTLSKAQTAEVGIMLNEQFFDSLLDAIFKNFNAPEFSIAKNNSEFQIPNSKSKTETQGFVSSFQANEQKTANQTLQIISCKESIRLQREIDGVRTSVRFRDGRIYAPIAFSGSYNPPLIGCIDFRGWAETNIDLEFDRQTQKLIGKVRVLNVQLSGTGGIGSSVLTRLVQSSIDRKINPIEIFQTDKLSFLIPIQNAGGSLQMKAVGVRHELGISVLNVYIAYQFIKVN